MYDSILQTEQIQQEQNLKETITLFLLNVVIVFLIPLLYTSTGHMAR